MRLSDISDSISLDFSWVTVEACLLSDGDEAEWELAVLPSCDGAEEFFNSSAILGCSPSQLTPPVFISYTAPIIFNFPDFTLSAVIGLLDIKSDIDCHTLLFMAVFNKSWLNVSPWTSLAFFTAGIILSTSDGILPCNTAFWQTAVTAPHSVWPSTTNNGVSRWSTPYSIDPASSISQTFPATLITNTSPIPTSKILSTGTLESEHEIIVAKGCWPFVDVLSLRDWVIFGNLLLLDE